MAKFYGKIGYSNFVETVDGVWVDQPTEREYYGDVLRDAKQWRSNDKLNDDLVINNRITIVADSFAASNFSAMRYVVWGEVYWEVTNVEIQRPRIILTLGGVYNGPKA